MNDPTNWNADLETLKVGDVFTEEWLDRFRELMTSYNAAIGALHEAEEAFGRGNYNEREDAAMTRIRSVLYTSHR